jgi:uncharacterized protein DUF2442
MLKARRSSGWSRGVSSRLLLDERERFLSFEHFPWFRDVSIGELCNVELPHPQHLYGPDLDVDLALESIDHPERFPLVSQAGRTGACSRRARNVRAADAQGG